MLNLKGGGGELLYEKAGDARRSLRSVNQSFWSHSGCSGRNATIFSGAFAEIVQSA